MQTLIALLATGFVVPPSINHRCAATARTCLPTLNAALNAEKYGGDPRASLAEERGAPIVGDAAWAVANTKRGAVHQLETAEQLEAAIQAAGDGMVVIKFETVGCQKCEETRPFFLDAASEYADKGLFYVVNFMRSKKFCKQVGIKFVPAAHIYSGGEQCASMGLKEWPEFHEELTAVATSVA